MENFVGTDTRPAYSKRKKETVRIMTQYDKEVERQRRFNAAQEWAKGIKYIYLADGIVETKFNNGDKLFESDGKKRFERKNMTDKELLNSYGRHQADSR